MPNLTISAFDLGVFVTLLIFAVIFWRVASSATFRRAMRTPRVDDLVAQLESYQDVIETLSEQNTTLRNRLQQALADRQAVDLQLERLRGELGRGSN